MKKLLCLTLLILLTLQGSMTAQPVTNYTGRKLVIGDQVAILQDPSNGLDFNSVQHSDKFTASTQATPNLGLSKSTIWLKFTIHNQSSETDLMIDLENPTLTDCHFYFPEDGKYKTSYSSTRWPSSHRKYQYADFLFEISLPKDSTATYFLKVKGKDQIILPLILGNRQVIIRSKMNAQMLWGIFIGIVLVMSAYNFLLFIFTKDKSYLYYVLYCLFMGLAQITLNGYTYHYLLGGYPWLLNKVYIIFPAIGAIAAVLFVRRFLETKKRTPRLNKLFVISIASYSLAIVLRLLGLDLLCFRTMDISALVTTIILYVVAIKIAFQGYRPAKYFLFAWTIFLTGITLYTLRNLGILPYNEVTSYTMALGVAIEITLLSIALADRINMLRREKELSQANAILIAGENERIIREQNASLEIKVTERTAALNSALNELKQAETQLVESEKMATLGQLTAGIAHEVNNPINFVTSNVSPLRRDVEILFNAIDHLHQLALSDIPKEEKMREIQQYTQDQELDYLRTEVGHLLNGIHNGATRTAEIVRSLKLFSRLDEDSLKYAGVAEGIDSSMIILSNQLNNINIVREYGELPSIECYPGKLNQVFLNILSNAIFAIRKRFEEKPGGILTIITRLQQEEVTIIFEDNGIGMDKDTQDNIFNPFFTTKEVGEGTGLGLSISHTILKKHNGSIQVETTLEKGAKFIINLPIHQPPS